MNIFRARQTFYSPCPSLAGIDTRLCCQAGHRDASLVVNYTRRLAFRKPAEQATEPQAKREVRLAVTYQESSCIDVQVKRERHHCVSRKPTLTAEVDLLARYGRCQ